MLCMYYLGICQYMQKAKVTLKNRETIAGVVSGTQVNLQNFKAYSISIQNATAHIILIVHMRVIVIPL